MIFLYIKNLLLIISLSLFLAAVSFSNEIKHSVSVINCEKETLSRSALHHGTYLLELSHVFKMLSEAKQSDAKKLLQTLLEAEMAVAETVLIQLSSGKSAHSPKDFDSSIVGEHIRQLLSKNLKTDKSPASYLPKNIRDSLGHEGSMLFNAVYKLKKQLKNPT